MAGFVSAHGIEGRIECRNVLLCTGKICGSAVFFYGIVSKVKIRESRKTENIRMEKTTEETENIRMEKNYRRNREYLYGVNLWKKNVE